MKQIEQTMFKTIKNWFKKPKSNKFIEKTGKEHDFRCPTWGWALQTSMMTKVEPGEFSCLGHGSGIKKGDWIRFKTKQEPKYGRRFLVKDIKYYRDPPDMFSVKLELDENEQE